MKRITPFTWLAILLMTLSPTLGQATGISTPDGLRFTENRGQYVLTNGQPAAEVLFKAQATGSDIYLTRSGMSFVLISLDRHEEAFHDMEGEMAEKMRMKDAIMNLERIDLNLNNINPRAQIVTAEPSASYDNFYYGHCPDGITHVPSYGDITYSNVYPNIDWHITTHDGMLKTEFIVHPGGDPSRISLGVNGAQRYGISPDGSLLLEGSTGHVTDAAPTAMQGTSPISVQFARSGGSIRFDVGQYDHDRDLIIDPYTRVYSTFFGSSGGEWYLGHVTTTDAAGRVYLAGHSPGPSFPTTAGAYQSVAAGSNDGFVAQFSNAGVRNWCTYYGGSGSEGGIAFKAGLCTDPSDNVWFSTVTSSTNFPVTAGCFQPAISTGPDATLVKLSSTGTRLYATYYGGSGTESPGISRWGANSAPAIASDGSGNIFMTGLTGSTNLPVTAGCFQAANAGGLDAYLVKWSNAGARLYASYYGGSSNEEAAAVGIAVDVAGNAWMTGCTASPNFPTTAGAFQTVFGGVFDQYLVKWNNACVRQYSTFYGGNNDEGILCDVDVASNGDVWLGVFVQSTNFPVTAGASQGSNAGGWDFGVVRFNNAGVRQYASYYGSSDQEEPWDISVDRITGNVCLTGAAWGTAFPTLGPPFQSVSAGSQEGAIVVLNPSGAPLYVTYYGGPGHDEVFSSAFDINQSLWVAGMAAGAGFPFTAGAFQTAPPGNTDPFLAKFTPPIILDQGLVDLAIESVAGNTIYLGWSYENDANVKTYTLERDLGGRWDAITTQSASGNARYTYTDEVPVQGMVQYRLALTMLDGSQAYSTLVRTQIEMTEDRLLAAWPNPLKAGDDLHFQYQMAAKGTLTATVTNMAGQRLAEKEYELQAGRARLELTTRDLAAGTYLLQLSSALGKANLKFTLQ